MEKQLQDFLTLAFVSLFTMVNPLGVVPVFMAMTQRLKPHEARIIAGKSVLIASLLLLGFALTGQFVFQFFGISVNSLRVAGGVLFFFMGYEMLQARLSRTQATDESIRDYMSDVALTPLAIPVICGPGAIATVIVLMGDAQNSAQQVGILGVIIAIMLITYVVLLSGERIMKFLGDSGSKVLLRLMGLIVMSIAVEFFFGGLKPIVRDMLMLGAS